MQETSDCKLTKYASQLDEPLLAENPNRFVLLPIKCPDIYEAYKAHMRCFWTVDEIDLH